MFNSSLKKDALAIHKKEVEKYDSAYQIMINSCDELYQQRVQSVECIDKIGILINWDNDWRNFYESRLHSRINCGAEHGSAGGSYETA